MTDYDNGVIRVTVPEGWLAFCGTDSGGCETPKKLHIYKDAVSPLDIFTRAGITVCFYGRDEILLPSKWFYDDACDIEPFECGDKLWQGYTCSSFGFPYTMLDTRVGEVTFQVMILKKNGEHEISLKDDDVRTVLESLAPSKGESAA